MGIQGLLPQLKSIMAPIHVEELRGKTVAVDTYSWLHKGALSCSAHLCKGIPTTKHIDYCMHRVNLLRHHGIKPILVFDGGFLPMKMDQENKRSRARKENLERAIKHEELGNSSTAFECYQKAVDISPSIAFELIQVLKTEKVDYIVAPYEADAQMTFLSINKYVDAVITEDSDLIPFGCPRIIFKMDKFGQAVDFQWSKIGKNKELGFTGFTKQMFLEMCIFSGCDYLQSLPGMGLKRAHALVQKLKSYEKVIKHLKYSAVSVPPLYEETFKKAIWAFQHQRVYDPRKEDIIHLSDIPDGLVQDLDFLGPWLPQSVIKGIATGDLDPLTKMPFQGKEGCAEMMLKKTYSITEFPTANGRKRMDLPVQKNILTNYFCLASIEAKRKFRAPKVVSKNLETISSSSPCSENHDLDSPGSTQETSIQTIKQTQSSLSDSEKFEDEVSTDEFVINAIKYQLQDTSSNKSKTPTEPPQHGSHNSLKYPCPLLESKYQPSKPFLASHKEANFISSPTAPESQIKSASRKVIVRSKYFQHKLLDENRLENQNDESIIKDINSSYGKLLMSKGASIENTYEGNATKKRKLIDILPVDRGDIGVNDVHTTSALEEDSTNSNLNRKAIDMKVDGNIGCDISHLNNYSGIAQKSMDRFVSLLSSFRYNSSGSRASGLRAPLKDVQNTCSIRPAPAPIDFDKYRYTSGNKKTL